MACNYYKYFNSFEIMFKTYKYLKFYPKLINISNSAKTWLLYMYRLKRSV